MESPAPVSRYISQNSKKRLFTGESSSSSSGCKEVEIVEIPPVINCTSKLKSEQKEVICHDIIDVDMEEDGDDVMVIDGGVARSVKAKKHFSGRKSNEGSSANSVKISKKGLVDDYSSNLFYGEDAWIDNYYDDISFDDDIFMESRLDHMDIPPGVEAPFPWLSGPTASSSKVASTASATSTSKNQSDKFNPIPGYLPPLKINEPKNLPSFWSKPKLGSQEVNLQKGKLSSIWSEPGLPQKNVMTPSSASSLSSKPFKGSVSHKHNRLNSNGKSGRSSHGPYAYPLPPPFVNFLPPGHSYPLSGPSFPKTISQGSYMPMWQDMQDSAMNMVNSAMGSSGLWNQNDASQLTSAPITVDPKNVPETLQKFDLFKKFDTVEDYSDHHFSKNSSAKQPPKGWAKRVQEEWRILENDLPDKIFVRVYESRMDLLRAVIVGAEGTPYHDGLFFFDVYFPATYPNVPPLVHYISRGFRINPNLYNCGKVCLSLLNTWSGSQKEKWIPGSSTMLQVLVSIQGLILNAKPYFNEPGYESMNGSERGEKCSLNYNEKTFMHSLQTMVYTIRTPPKHFEDYIAGHFCKHGKDILVSCKAYLDGAPLCSLVKGGIQDVDEGDKSCSPIFKKNLAGFIKSLVDAFSQVGASGCQEFLSLANKAFDIPIDVPVPHRAAPWVHKQHYPYY